MCRLNRIAAAVSIAAAWGGAQAADIAWATGPTFNGPNGHLGILTNGSLVEAINLSGSTVAVPTVDPGGINLTFSSVNSAFFPQSYGTATGGGNVDPGWSQILATFEWQSSSDVTAVGFLSGLTAGHDYQVQLFSARGDHCCGRTHWFGDGNSHTSAPLADDSYVSVVGSFTADATSQTLQFFDSSHNPYLNAYVLRDLTSPVPEPGTVGLMLAGLAVVGAVQGRRDRKVRLG